MHKMESVTSVATVAEVGGASKKKTTISFCLHPNSSCLISSFIWGTGFFFSIHCHIKNWFNMTTPVLLPLMRVFKC